MSIIKIVTAVFSIISFGFSLDINIRGIVTDTGTTPLSGANVKLEKYGLTAITEADGNFALTGAVGIHINTNSSQSNKLSAKIYNKALFIDMRERGAVEIIMYTFLGKAISKVHKVMDIGTHRIEQSHTGSGVYLYKIKAGNSELIIKSHSTGRFLGSTGVNAHGLTSTATVSRAKRCVPINDVIAVTKDGYLNYRVIVTNSDTSGIEIKLIVCAGTVTDIDGHVYQTVKIGNQVWTVENLRTTKYNDGSAIPLVTDYDAWSALTTPGYCFYNNTTNADSIKKYGALYNWYAIDIKKLAPQGWHVSSDSAWYTLQNYLIANGYNWDGTTDSNMIAKSLAAKADWREYSTPGTTGNDLTSNNRSGFSALPAGDRGTDGYFYLIGEAGGWWSATENDVSSAWFRNLHYGDDKLIGGNAHNSCGLSVRLLRD